ncbi:ATP synthase subunit delta, mitochondrial [Neocloeon triangulifer]|uniref:ATP synthase subunit delta, mitochondrial n=1 Tax=Neocloeon triangulifer TaxID=2078957 RepID=UPI00286FA300|nr:ATP synthase subunit delta, mitochondrial [Neocloeon triangulifer]XP_059472709.1 ATP synthase subunit delta, mitochondrial [Neocloeon triangulifer]XP_059472710.1 ATP synthase subunit delta, mitochondrial [Neocloeon triangulifer]
MAVVGRSARSALRLLATKPLGRTAVRRGYADGNEMSFTFAAANQVFYNEANVRQVDVPSFSGAFGILPKHVPTLAVLKPGVVTVLEADGSPKRFFVSSGSVTINDDSSVQILAEEAVPVENLDAAAARDALSKAQSALSSASGDQARAEAQIAVEVAEEVVKACE